MRGLRSYPVPASLYSAAARLSLPHFSSPAPPFSLRASSRAVSPPRALCLLPQLLRPPRRSGPDAARRLRRPDRTSRTRAMDSRARDGRAMRRFRPHPAAWLQATDVRWSECGARRCDARNSDECATECVSAALLSRVRGTRGTVQWIATAIEWSSCDRGRGLQAQQQQQGRNESRGRIVLVRVPKTLCASNFETRLQNSERQSAKTKDVKR